MPKNKNNEKEMLGGCCVCADDRGWTENPLVYCDGEGCNVAVHQACYGIVTIPTTNWYCRKCETPDLDQVKCELCPSSTGALKPTDGRGWAHVVCSLYIPEVSFGNVATMEPIIINQIPQERFNKTCYICEEGGKGAVARIGACMQCNRSGCRQVFHVTCAQAQGLLCEEAGNYQDNVKYCGYCHHHYNKLKKGGHVKTIPPYRPVSSGDEIHEDDHKQSSTKRKLSSSTATAKSGKNSSGGGVNHPVGDVSLDGDTTNQIPNGDSPELSKFSSSSSVGTKKRKSNRSSTPVVHSDTMMSAQQNSGNTLPIPASESPRPQTPSINPPSTNLRPNSPSATSYTNTNGGVSKVGSIVVQVPLEAAGVGGSSPSPSPLHPVPTVSPPPSDSSSSHGPTKRSRSESSDKGEKRRSKRSSNGSVRPLRKSSPTHSRVKSSPEPMVGSVSVVPTITLSSLSTKTITSSSTGTASGSHSTTQIKEEKDIKLYENGVAAAHMLGNQLAPGSSMAGTLSQEVAAHSIYTKPSSSSHVGPHFPKPAPYRGPGSSTGLGPWGSSGSNMPQTLEQLLERQWEQGSQFLMEQAHHFDIASLLSCLHQLKAENAQLEEHVNSLQARRDNLLAVNARLAIPLVSTPLPTGGNNVGSAGGRVSNSLNTCSNSNSSTSNTSTVSMANNASLATAVLNTTSVGPAIVENGLPSQHEQFRLCNLPRVDSHRNTSTPVSGSYSTVTSTPVVGTTNTTPHHTTAMSHNTTTSGNFHSSTSIHHSNIGGNHHTTSTSSSNHTTTTSGHHSTTSSTNVHQSQSNQSSVVVRATSATPSLPVQTQSRSSSSGGYGGSNYSSSTNSQVLVRRSGDDGHKPSSGS